MRKAFFFTGPAMGLLLLPLTVPAIVTLDKVAAVVNNDPITLSDVRDELKQEGREESSDNDKKALEALIEKKLVAKEVQRLGIAVAEDEIDEAVRDVMRKNGISEDELKRNVEGQGISYEAYREKLRSQIERAKLINKELRSRVTVSDEDLRGYYQKNTALFVRPEEVRIQHILLRFPQGADAVKKRAVRARAEDILAQVRKGKDFSRLARLYSEDLVTASGGGDLGFIRKGELQPAFEKAAFSLMPGQAGIVETTYGCHIIKAIEKRTARPVPFEEVVDQVRESIFQEKAEKIFHDWVEELKQQAVIDRKL